MLGNKQNVFDDLYASAEWLISQGYTSNKRLVAFGGSNGGLLVGAAADATPGPVQWHRVFSAAAGHGALSQIPHRPLLDSGVR